MQRRAFLGASAFFLFDPRVAGALLPQAQSAVKGPDLREELSADEAERVNASAMAKDMGNFFGKGFS